MRKVVANSTPMIALYDIGYLDILRRLYGEVFIPEAVLREGSVKRDSLPGWVRVERIRNRDDKRMYRAKLHDGEVEVMILAQELGADLVILDDNAAKRTARYLELSVTGTLGVLLKAKERGIIENVAPILDLLREDGFYTNKALMSLVLKSAGELPLCG